MPKKPDKLGPAYRWVYKDGSSVVWEREQRFTRTDVEELICDLEETTGPVVELAYVEELV